MFRVIKNGLIDFKASYKTYLSFEFIYMILTSFLFVPFISFLFNRMLLRMSGTSSLLNNDVYHIALSYTGILGMLLIGFVAVVIFLIEFGVLILISQKRYFTKNVLISEAFITTIRTLPRLLGIGMFYLIFILLLIIPITDSNTLPALLDFNIPIYLTSTFYESWFSLIVYVILFIIFVYLFIRWIFTLHFMFIEKKSIRKSMKSSFIMTKKYQGKVMFNLILINVLIYVTVLLIMSFVSYLISLIELHWINNFLQNAVVTLSGYVTIITSLLLMPINITIITRLFYRYKIDHGEPLEDNLNLKRSKLLTRFEKKVIRLFKERKKIVIAVVIAYISTMFLLNYVINDSLVYLRWDVKVASHRGDNQAPENSISSIVSAMEKGVDVVEIDVMTTKDGFVVLNHDKDLNRIAGVKEKVSEMTYRELLQIDIGKRYSDAFAGERVPTLNRVLNIMKENEIPVIIDIKSASEDGELAKKIVRLIEYHEMEELSYVQSFDNDVLKEIRELNPDIKIGQIMFLAAGNLEELDVDFYTVRQSMLTKRFVRNAHKLNREVWVWTVNIERNMREVLKYDIDGIITDYPEKLQSIIGIDFSSDEAMENKEEQEQ